MDYGISGVRATQLLDILSFYSTRNMLHVVANISDSSVSCNILCSYIVLYIASTSRDSHWARKLVAFPKNMHIFSGCLMIRGNGETEQQALRNAQSALPGRKSSMPYAARVYRESTGLPPLAESFAKKIGTACACPNKLRYVLWVVFWAFSLLASRVSCRGSEVLMYMSATQFI